MPAPPISNTVVQQDLPTAFSTVGNWLSVAGWAIDLRSTSGTGVNLVQVWAYPNPGAGAAPFALGNATYGRSRPDVGAAFGARYANSGFQLDMVGMNPGVYDIVTIARNTITGTVDTARVKRVTVYPEVMIMVVARERASAAGFRGQRLDDRPHAAGNNSGICDPSMRISVGAIGDDWKPPICQG